MAGAVLLVAVLLCAAHSAFALSNGLGKTPPMGWNSWNHFNCHVNETLLRETAAAFVKTGLSAVGYQYINVDDCWQVERDDKGFIKEDAQAFPSGMKALADYIHSQGLKFGVYSDAGYKTCAGRPGSLNFEAQDAQTYASWGVDYLKYDNCNPDFSSPKKRYPKMRDALATVSRPIFFSMCEWGVEDPATWAKEVGNSWRTTGDISDNWGSFLGILDANDKWWKYAGPGGWNDPDMLEVGNGGMTAAEYRAHFSLWALMKAPLLIGCDIRSIPDATLSILNNTEVIAVNQDALGVQGHKIVSSAGKDVWAGPLADGSVAVVLFNRNQQPTSITAQWQDIGLASSQTATVRDLWKHADVGTAVGSFSANVEGHSVVMLRITPVHSLSLSN